ncbi:unnamed protein product [Calypogeia fissa]
MACRLPAVLHLPASTVVSLESPIHLTGVEGRRGGGGGGGGAVVWRRRGRGIGRQCWPLVAALNTETASSSASSSSSSGQAEKQGPPIIELQFLSPDSTSDFQTLSAVSGEKNLRKFMLEKKLELYTFYGKVMNCGGGGSCGTCIVEILEGQELLSERTDAEYNYLKKNPESWRLACQTIVGDKSNSGKVVVQRLPQKK